MSLHLKKKYVILADIEKNYINGNKNDIKYRRSPCLIAAAYFVSFFYF